AGVWVIAESKSLPATLRKIVATDDQGRYLVPDLPAGEYSVWVRGYGLVDSTRQSAAPGKVLNLTAVPAPNAKAAAEYYPALYWFALMKMPPKSDFPGTGPTGNGISPNVKSQGEWIRQVVNTDGCTGCHQLGNKATREIPAGLGEFATSAEAWDRRIRCATPQRKSSWKSAIRRRRARPTIRRRSPRRTGATRRSGRRGPPRTASPWTRTRASGSPPAFARTRRRRSASRDRLIPPRRR